MFTSIVLSILTGCPEPPPEVTGEIPSDAAGEAAVRPNRGGRSGDPDSMDLSPGGTVLLNMNEVVPRNTQEALNAAGGVVTISGTLWGDCTDGTLRIDVIELGVVALDSGPMVGPLTALSPAASGPYSLVVPAGSNVQLAALCDVDNDGKIVQDKDKLAPGVALGAVEEDKTDVDLVFPGEGNAPVDIEGPEGGNARPPGDDAASLPSNTAGERDREEGGVAPVPPPPEEAPAEEAPVEEAAPAIEEEPAPAEEE